MNELQLKLERRRKSIADMDSGARLDNAVSSQKAASGFVPAASSAAQNEMLAKLERRRRLNEESTSTEAPTSVSVAVVQAGRTDEAAAQQSIAVPEPPPPGIQKSKADTTRTEIDTGSIPVGRPPVSQRSHRAPPPVPPTRSPPAPSSPSPTEGISPSGSNVDLSGLSPSNSNEVGSSAAALVLPWNQGIYSLRERKTPDKSDKTNMGLNEAHAKQHRRRRSIKMKLSSDFDVNQALGVADRDTLLAILNELELELGPG